MWTISDFPAYSLISGLCCKGYKGCPPCGPLTDARMARTGDVLPNGRTKGSKIVYGGVRRYLPRHHPYHRNKRFNGFEEHRRSPEVVSGLDVIRYAAWRQSYLDLGGQENRKDDPVHVTGVKLLSALFELPYWQVRLENLLYSITVVLFHGALKEIEDVVEQCSGRQEFLLQRTFLFIHMKMSNTGQSDCRKNTACAYESRMSLCSMCTE